MNNPRRTQDLEDIRALIAANSEVLDMQRGSGIRSALRQGTTAAGADRVNAPSRTQPLVDDAGLPGSPGQTSQNPFADLDDLMCVVEALCPKWPERPTFEESRIFLI